MVNYQYSKIYKIVNTINNDFYIGSTTYQYLCARINSHRMLAKDVSGRRESKLYKLMRELGVDNFKIELIENVNCDNVKDLREREQYYINLLKPTLNMINSKVRTPEEITEYKRVWAANKRIKEGHIPKPKRDKEYWIEYKKQWYLKNKTKQI